MEDEQSGLNQVPPQNVDEVGPARYPRVYLLSTYALSIMIWNIWVRESRGQLTRSLID